MSERSDLTYDVDVEWTGNLGSGTRNYRAYSRDHLIRAADRPPVPGSSDPLFRGDATRYSPEELFVASISSCHLLWYLHLCADAGVTVHAYVDRVAGQMELGPDGAGSFTEIRLNPEIRVAPGTDVPLAETLHDRAHRMCFLANSVNFSVSCTPSVTVAEIADREDPGADASHSYQPSQLR